MQGVWVWSLTREQRSLVPGGQKTKNRNNTVTNSVKTLKAVTSKNLLKKQSTNSICWRGWGEKEMLLHCWWDCKLVWPLQKPVWRFLKKVKADLPYDSAIPLLGIYVEKTIIWKDTGTPVFIAALFTIDKTQEQPKCPSTDEWIMKVWYGLPWWLSGKESALPMQETQGHPLVW